MLVPSYSNSFEKDLKKLVKSSLKDVELVKEVIKKLIEEIKLEKKHRNHVLIGNFKGRMECHVKPDLLLVYKINEEEKTILFERIGTHSELFK